MKSVTFGHDFVKPNGRRKQWPHIHAKDANMWLEGGLLFIQDLDGRGGIEGTLCFHPSNVQMQPFEEDLLEEVPELQKPQLKAAGR